MDPQSAEESENLGRQSEESEDDGGMQGGACADKAVGCVMGAFVGNALGAALKNLYVSEINESKVTKVMNFMEKPLGLEIGQTEIEFGINLALINALNDQKELDLDKIIY